MFLHINCDIYITNIIDNVTVLLQNSLSLTGSINNCTIMETDCLSGEQFSDRIDAINSIPSDYSEYFNTWENNETVTCFMDVATKNVYLKADSALAILIILGIALTLILLLCILCGCFDACYHKHS